MANRLPKLLIRLAPFFSWKPCSPRVLWFLIPMDPWHDSRMHHVKDSMMHIVSLDLTGYCRLRHLWWSQSSYYSAHAAGKKTTCGVCGKNSPFFFTNTECAECGTCPAEKRTLPGEGGPTPSCAGVAVRWKAKAFVVGQTICFTPSAMPFLSVAVAGLRRFGTLPKNCIWTGGGSRGSTQQYHERAIGVDRGSRSLRPPACAFKILSGMLKIAIAWSIGKWFW